MPSAPPAAGKPSAADHEILFQKWFKSVGPRTCAAQVKKAGNGNHYLVLTEGKRDDKTGEIRKTRLFLFSEDFVEFFKLLHETAVFIRENPVPEDVKKRQERHWAKGRKGAGRKGNSNSGLPASRRPNVARTAGKSAMERNGRFVAEGRPAGLVPAGRGAP